MNQERWRRVEDLFHAALGRPPDVRRSFLDAACADDAELRQQVERLVSKDEQDITGTLAAWKGGDAGALDRLMDLVYPELRRIAHRQIRRRRPGESLESAALANEAYLKLACAGGLGCENRVHFLALCAQMMRRILVDHARQQRSVKRGGNLLRVPLDDVLLAASARGVDVLALDEALGRLARVDRRKSRVVELRYFGGLTIGEAAATLGVSIETAKRDWRMARAWLLAELTVTQAPNDPGVPPRPAASSRSRSPSARHG